MWMALVAGIALGVLSPPPTPFPPEPSPPPHAPPPPSPPSPLHAGDDDESAWKVGVALLSFALLAGVGVTMFCGLHRRALVSPWTRLALPRVTAEARSIEFRPTSVVVR